MKHIDSLQQLKFKIIKKVINYNNDVFLKFFSKSNVEMFSVIKTTYWRNV